MPKQFGKASVTPLPHGDVYLGQRHIALIRCADL
jgi:hypothetical protein